MKNYLVLWGGETSQICLFQLNVSFPFEKKKIMFWVSFKEKYEGLTNHLEQKYKIKCECGTARVL